MGVVVSHISLIYIYMANPDSPSNSPATPCHIAKLLCDRKEICDEVNLEVARKEERRKVLQCCHSYT